LRSDGCRVGGCRNLPEHAPSDVLSRAGPGNNGPRNWCLTTRRSALVKWRRCQRCPGRDRNRASTAAPAARRAGGSDQEHGVARRPIWRAAKLFMSSGARGEHGHGNRTACDRGWPNRVMVALAGNRGAIDRRDVVLADRPSFLGDVRDRSLLGSLEAATAVWLASSSLRAMRQHPRSAALACRGAWPCRRGCALQSATPESDATPVGANAAEPR
jgi:hypothetical protein